MSDNKTDVSNNTISILKNFKNNLITFLDELINQFPQESDLIIARIFLKDQIPILDIMNYVCFKLIPLKHLVKNRDEHFFLDNNILFDNFQKNKVNHFKKLWRSGLLDTEDKEIIFKWFDTFLYLAEKYQKSLE
jgi:hypothetical protein